VIHAAAGSNLKQVRVAIDGTALEAFTDESGEFRLVGVPAGDVMLRASVAGLGQQSARVRVTAGQVARQDFDLGSRETTAATAAAVGDQPVKLDVFTVAERELTAQSAALQEQRIAPNIKNVVAFEEFGELGDGNTGDFMKFVPGLFMGIGVGTPSDPAIRGMPASGTLITVDGIELSSDTPSSRNATLQTSNTNNIDRIEVTKVPTPDMPANAVGGMINLVSKSGFSRRAAQFSYSVFGTLTSKKPFTSLGREMFDRDGADSTTDTPQFMPGFDFTYIKPINPSLALSISGSHNMRGDNKDALTSTWNRIAFIQTQSAENAQIALRERNSATVRVDWKPGAGHAVFANFQFTSDDLSSRIYGLTQAYGAGATGGENFTQGAATGVGSTTLATTYREQLKATWHAAVGYRLDRRAWKIEATLARSQSRRQTISAEDGHDYFGTTSATLTNLVLRADGFGDLRFGVPPTVRGTRAGQSIDITDGRLYTLNTATSPTEPRMRNNVTTFKLNASRDLGLAFAARLMAGVDLSRNERFIRSETRTWSFRPTFAAGAPERLAGSYDLINEAYSARRSFRNGDRVRWIDPRKVYALYQANPAWFVLNEAAYYISHVTGAQNLEESISAGFLRADVKLLENRLWLVGGVRYERTDDEGAGALNDLRATYRQDAQGNLFRNAAGQLERVSTDALTIARLQYKRLGSVTKKHYGDFYPSLNASYSFAENFVARAAYARTIGRPALNFIIPSSTIADPAAAEENRTINTTNAGLKPWSADNYDLSLESYSVKGATAAVSLFRKNISGFFVSTRTDATLPLLAAMGLSDDYLDYDVITRTNSSDVVTISGIEWSWRQSFKPFTGLPKWTRGVYVWVNGTNLRLSGASQDNFSPYCPRIINWGGSYATTKFVLKYNVTQIGLWRAALNAPSATLPAGTFNGEDVRKIQDGSVEYRFHRKFALFAAVRNLANAPRPLVVHSPSIPAYTRPSGFTFYGALWTMGIKGTF
jgi:TonB-dependent receptor